MGSKDLFQKFKEVLVRKEKKIQEELSSVDQDDPLLEDGLAEARESGTDAWISDAHTQLSAMRKNLEDVLGRVKKALMNFNTGKYGKCEKCGIQIEKERLAIMPEALTCITCSKKR